MKSIEITTAHNIVIEQELGRLSHRILAFGIDAAILVVYIWILTGLTGGNTIILYVAGGLAIIFYHLIWEIFNNGQSPGKKAMNLRVVCTNGVRPSLQDYIIRWSFRLIDITGTFGCFAVLTILTSDRNQRMGDLLSNTAVINLRNSNHVSLERLLSIDSLVGEVSYHQIKQYSDQDMLLVKHALQRYSKVPNEANKKVIKDLTVRICEDLRIQDQKVRPTEFLKKVLSDYIILTR